MWTGEKKIKCSLSFRWQLCRCRQIWPLVDWGRFRLSPAKLRSVPHDRSRGRPPSRERCRHSDCRGPWLPSQNPTPRGRHACKVVRQGWERGEREGKVGGREKEGVERKHSGINYDREAENSPSLAFNTHLQTCMQQRFFHFFQLPSIEY